jgi:predicted ATPase/class 3 adenylate cyclase
MHLPSGTVTFLFSDIEGSTRLWEAHPTEMQSALARHDRLIRESVVQAGGHVFKTVGDAFCIAFHTAPEALHAAQQIQVALDREPWPTPISLKVRMALNTGAVELRDHDYFGPPLNRVARLLAVAHGGQILLSDATQQLSRDALPPQTTLKSLGEHRLKDLARAESIFQLCHPELNQDFPPLSSHKSTPNNLPHPLTSFIGREKELAELQTLFASTHLLTLTGSGGSGKTRLSLRLAAEMLDDRSDHAGFRDGVWLVELAPLADPALVVQSVASVVGVRETEAKPVAQSLIDHLKEKRLLLILDNCEHLLTACASLAETLLTQCPRMKILASSREALGIGGERTYRVPSLTLPNPQKPMTSEALGRFESVRLFLERAQFHQPNFAITDQNAPALASICRRLDGMPLAIELAAARIRSMSLQDINQRLDQRFRLLTGGSRMALPRQQALRSLIDWSYDLLGPAEKAVLCRVSVFSGGWNLTAAEKVCSGDPVEEWNVLDILTSLADKSLILAEPFGETIRYRLLETVRQYARDRLLESGEAQVWRTRHLRHFLMFAEEADPHLIGQDQREWFDRLEAEHDNLRTALAWAVEDEEDPQIALRLCACTWRLCFVRGRLAEGLEWCKCALDRDSESTSSARATTLNGAAALAQLQGNYELSRTLVEQAIAIRREMGDWSRYATGLSNLGNIHTKLGEFDRAKSLYEESIALHRKLGEQHGEGQTLNNYAALLTNMAQYDEARPLIEKALELARSGQHPASIAFAEGNLGTVALHQNDYPAARIHLGQSLSLLAELGDTSAIASLFDLFAALAARQSDPSRAARLWGASDALREEIGTYLDLTERALREKLQPLTREALTQAAFDRLYSEGHSWPTSRAIAWALNSA